MRLSALLTTLAVLIGALASIASAPNLKVGFAYELAAAFSLIALASQWKASKPFILPVKEDDWQVSEGDQYRIVVPVFLHGKGTSAAGRLEWPTTDGFEQVLADIESRSNGDIVVTVAARRSAVAGRIVIT